MEPKIYDISPLIGPETAVFPGDTPFAQTVHLDISKGNNLTLSSINTTVHIGAHADSPSHYIHPGQSIHAVNLSKYLGQAQVISVSAKGERITPDEIKNIKIESKRVLFKTQSFPNPNKWNSDFRSLSPELVDYLAEHSVVLIGIDTPSIDPEQDASIASHKAVSRHDIAVLEGIVLSNVNPGIYQLIALPLKLKNLDASPVRAVLLDLSYNISQK